MNDSLASSVLSYFLAKTEDKQIKCILEQALNTSRKHIQQIVNEWIEQPPQAQDRDALAKIIRDEQYI